MKAAGGLEGADPTDLAGLREAEVLADPEGKPAPIGMSRIEVGGDVLSLLPDIVSELTGEAPRVVLVDYVIEHLGELLPRESRAAARVPDERDC